MRTLAHTDTMVEEKPALVCERPLFTVPRQLTELELQAHWFAGNFGRDFTSSDGEVIRIVQFGVWNHEAGPDFADAAVSVNGGAPKRGCIELDTDARDWERHGHAENPAYEDVILHVCLQSGPSEFFARTASHRLVRRVLLDRGKLTHEPLNPLPEAQLGRCVGPLRNLSDERARAVLLAAAQVRLQRKAAALVTLRELHGADEALYQGLATTLGYKSNKLPLTLIAQRLPVRTLLGHKQEAAALVFGVSGFLNNVNLREFDNRTREYLRLLWAQWWPHRTAFGRLVISSDLWRMTGQRPVNHPQRRLAALAHMVGEWRAIRALARKCEPNEIRRFFHAMSDEYWDFHYTLTSKAASRRMALVGESRATEMLANVFFPLAIADDPRRWDAYLKLPAQLTNRRVEVAALRLFGESGRKRELLRWAAMQQGLLQIYEDFCMQDASDCEQCRFPEQLARW